MHTEALVEGFSLFGYPLYIVCDFNHVSHIYNLGVSICLLQLLDQHMLFLNIYVAKTIFFFVKEGDMLRWTKSLKNGLKQGSKKENYEKKRLKKGETKILKKGK